MSNDSRVAIDVPRMICLGEMLKISASAPGVNVGLLERAAKWVKRKAA
jgi:hypothetical protein